MTRPFEMCGTPGCALPFAHLGICNVARVPLVRASDAPRACRDCDRAAGHPGVCTDDGLTPWAGGGGRLTVWGLIRTVCASPLGAMWGIALLVLLWLSGCA